MFRLQKLGINEIFMRVLDKKALLVEYVSQKRFAVGSGFIYG